MSGIAAVALVDKDGASVDWLVVSVGESATGPLGAVERDFTELVAQVA